MCVIRGEKGECQFGESNNLIECIEENWKKADY